MVNIENKKTSPGGGKNFEVSSGTKLKADYHCFRRVLWRFCETNGNLTGL